MKFEARSELATRNMIWKWKVVTYKSAPQFGSQKYVLARHLAGGKGLSKTCSNLILISIHVSTVDMLVADIERVGDCSFNLTWLALPGTEPKGWDRGAGVKLECSSCHGGKIESD